MPQTNTEWTLSPTIDRRPIAVINAYGHNTSPCSTDDDYPEEIERYGACWWRGPNATTNLISRIQGHYDAGYRRIMMNRPNGTTEHPLVPSPIWGALFDYKKAQWLDELKEYLNSMPDLDFGIYYGFRPTSSCESFNMSSDNIRVPDLTRREDVEWYKCNYGPLRDIGVKFLILDTAASDSNRGAFEELAAIMWSHGIKLMGEAIPKLQNQTLPNGQTGSLIDPDALDRGSYIFLEQHIRNGTQNQNGWPYWGIDSSTQEAHLMLQGNSNLGTDVQTPDSENFIQDWFARGFTVSVWNTGYWFYSYVIQNYGNVGFGIDMPTGFPFIAGQFGQSIGSQSGTVVTGSSTASAQTGSTQIQQNF